MSKLHQLREIGQSIWSDYIRRSFIAEGDLQRLVDKGVLGVTSNPSIFEKAITGSDDYDDALRDLVRQGKSSEEIYEALALEDIRRAADVLKSVYDETSGHDGYVSLEVSPTLAHETEATIAEARRFFKAVNRPNVMIKVPATPEGLPAIEQLTRDGVNVNVTLLFSTDNYQDVADAYISGLEQRAAAGEDVNHVASVASFFVSRVDTAVDEKLAHAGNSDLQGKIAIANAKIAYTLYQKIFSSERWEKLAQQGARPQRLLWGSTSTKNPAYPDTLYVDELIGPNTVNTAPLDTIEAFIDHGTVAETLTRDVDEARRQLQQLDDLGIDLDQVTAQLQDEGVEKFAKSFRELLAGIEEKCAEMDSGWRPLETKLGQYQTAVDDTLAQMRRDNVIARIWDHDHTVWKPDPQEITNRLGWLTIAAAMQEEVDRMSDFLAEVKSAGYTHALLLGMGGSSLAPEVFSNVFGGGDGYLKLAVLDSTDPGTVLSYDRQLDLSKTLFIVSTKSGGTVETLSFFKYFYNRVADELGAEEAGAHFAAITDPGSKLVDLAEKYDFRATFINDPNIGGRYSVLSFFGLLPAALVGVDVDRLLARTQVAAHNAHGVDGNASAELGAIMGALAESGRDKLTFVSSPPLANFGDWVEQLIAESTGKEGKGILPVVGGPLGAPDAYGDDRLFVYLRLDGDDTYDKAVARMADTGQPVIWVHLQDLYDLGAQFFLWEMATAVAGHLLGIQPFDQPNVESAKVQARKMVSAYKESGKLPEAETVAPSAARLRAFLQKAEPGDYIALQAYVQPTPDVDKALETLRVKLRDETRLAVTIGYGPRFLHSTGQLHKGDAGNGYFVQMTADMPKDAAIPDEAGKEASGMRFGVLKTAQALGDAAALREAGRRVIHFDLGSDVLAGIMELV